MAKRTDANHAEIRDGLRKQYQVLDMHEVGRGFPDLLAVSRRRIIVLLEVKTVSGKLDDAEKVFHSTFTGPCRVVRSLEDALQVMAYYDHCDEIVPVKTPGVAVAVDETDRADNSRQPGRREKEVP